MSRGRDGGMVLINVLVVLALAATMVYAMLTVADLAIARSQGFSDAGQGLALVRGGEQSAIAALRRDMIEAPDADYAGEAWGKIGQEPIAIAGGSFALEISDAQGLFNVNTLVGGRPESAELLERLCAAGGIDREVGRRIAASLSRDGPLAELGALMPRAGLTPEDLARLGRLVTALPGSGDINLNATPAVLLGVLLQNEAAARMLVQKRERAGMLTARDIEAAGVSLPPETGFRSDLFRVRTTVRIGEATLSYDSLLRRAKGPGGPEVSVIARRNAASSAAAPPSS